VIGEVRDGSALQMLNAWNTGHPGGLCTIHANSAHDALLRLEDLIGEVSVRIPVRTIASAVQLIAFIRRTPAGRAVETVARVTGHVDGQYRLETISG
jgi:type IV secretion system protein VirB11